MLSVTQLARRCGVSRTALLYYESIGLMPPPARTGGNYRSYSEADAERLRRIRAWRNAGLSLEYIRAILRTQNRRGRGGEASEVLKRRLVELDAEIEALRARRAPGIPGLPPHCSRGNQDHPRTEPETGLTVIHPPGAPGPFFGTWETSELSAH